MVKVQEYPVMDAERSLQTLTLGEFAHQVMREQYRHLVKQEKHVLADKDPEYLHQMRVGSRRLYTALQVFGRAVQLPKGVSIQYVRSLTKVLGKLRDLDVQIAALEEEYQPQITSKSERHHLQEAIAQLRQDRRKAFAGTRDVLSQDRYRNFRRAFEAWLETPQYTALGPLPIVPLLPDLLSPLLAELLLHPGWLIASDAIAEDTVHVLHDLRKACKHVRYQTDFFVPFYGESFQTWIKEIKGLQESLGQLQDTQVLRELLTLTLGKQRALRQLEHLMQEQQQTAMTGWDSVRDRYLSADYRRSLHQLLLDSEPVDRADRDSD